MFFNNNKKEVIGKTSQWLKLRDSNGENSYVMYETLPKLHHCNNNNLKNSAVMVNVYNKNDDLVGSVKIDDESYSFQLNRFLNFPEVECCKEEKKKILSKLCEDAKIKLPDNFLEEDSLDSIMCFCNKNEIEQKNGKIIPIFSYAMVDKF